jgi:hypothetical protein
VSDVDRVPVVQGSGDSVPDLASPTAPLLSGRWIASCPTCDRQLTEGSRQDRVERKAARRSYPVC